MDLTGLPAYAAVMEGLLPHLCNEAKPSKLIRDLAAAGAQGLGNGRGWYDYTPEEAKRWEQAWVDFTFDIRRVTDKYDARTTRRRKAKS
jgi:3-hydroxybutyryl-CoA dehydrogenase